MLSPTSSEWELVISFDACAPLPLNFDSFHLQREYSEVDRPSNSWHGTRRAGYGDVVDPMANAGHSSIYSIYSFRSQETTLLPGDRGHMRRDHSSLSLPSHW